MTTPAPRRAMFAELLLAGSPREIRERRDGESLSVTFDAITDLYTWLADAGLDTPDLSIGTEHTYTDTQGRRWRSVSATPQWQGWRIYAHATEPDTRPAALDGPTHRRLTVLAHATGREG